MSTDRARLRVRCRGAVQGVGFRPTVFRLATEAGLAGFVVNDAHGVTIEVEGTASTVEGFLPALLAALPPLARIDGLEREPLPPCGDATFDVRESAAGLRRGALVPPDTALCSDCRRDMETVGDRRHGYAFTTCTNCGPRFTLVRSLPYDRERTAMACFPLCPACAAEYRDPDDRRFHAEPVCCPDCGPRLWLEDVSGLCLGKGAAALCAASEALLAGAIVALKGLGGFQIACRADRSEVVLRLRDRKRRPRKPFAVMVASLEEAREVVALDEAATALLGSARAPIVVAPRMPGAAVVAEVAPGLDEIGVLLPTTPLHVELLRERGMPPLVMTSGNLSEEPICRTNREAVERLGPLVDLLLLHDRDIVRRVDDSVVRATPEGPVILRRARGWVPEPVPLPIATPRPVLAVGGHLQVTACVAVDGLALPSQHVGDLDSEPARAFHREALDGLEEFLEVRPDLVVADLHPDYPSGWVADELCRTRGGERLEVQHHLAHAAAVLGEHSRWPAAGATALAIILDGTGWGPDGTAWGGEWLRVAGDLRWQRLASLEPLPLVGAEAAVREPWRVAVAALVLQDATGLLPSTPLGLALDAERVATVARLSRKGSWPLATGAGRLFEAAGALLTGSNRNDWEGEAAALAEALAISAGETAPWAGGALREADGRLQLPSSWLLAELARRLAGGETPAVAAAGFHRTFCRMTAELTARTAAADDSAVALGGGCLVNRLLRRHLVEDLAAIGLTALLPRELPPGDGGLSYGQAVVGAVAAALDVRPEQIPP